MMTLRERRCLVLVALLLVVVTVLLAVQVNHVAAVAWLLVPVFLFGTVEPVVVLAAVSGEERLPVEPVPASLFERPPPFFG